MIRKLCVLSFLLFPTVWAAVPQLLNHQGRIAVNGTNFEGTGQFKFALVNATGTTTYWSNDNTSSAGSEPTAAVSLPVVKGLYAVLLGDAGMTALPTTVFDNADVRLRVWFNDGSIGFQQITPDQRLASAPYALNAAKAESVPDASITNAKLANSSVTVTAGAGLSGGGSVALGSNISLSNAGVLSLTNGGGISVSGSTGAITLGSNATAANTPSTLITRDASGNFSAGTITASLNGSAANFTGSLAGNVTGTQGATVVATVGGVTAANVASGANLANAATNLNTANAIVKRDASGNFTAGTITANGSALTSLNASNIASGTLADARLSANIPLLNAANTFTNHLFVGNNFTVPYRGGSTGVNNTFLGTEAGAANTTGQGNTVLGRGCFNANTTGNFNTALGYSVLQYSTTGNNNTGVGNFALTNTTAGDNTALGLNALRNVTSGSNNIGIGSSGGVQLTTGSNNIAIGHQGVAGDSNIIRIGTTQTDTYLTGIIHGNGSGLTNLPNAATTGTAANTPNTLVLRDASGNFTAGTITGTFVGNGSGLTGVNASQILLEDVIAPPIRPVVAWGDNDDGQTNVSTTLSNANTAAIAAGGSTSVALLKTGTVVQWGSGDAVPGGLINVTHIAAGVTHRLARKSDGTVTAWGDNSFGQSTVPGGLTTATNVAAGEKHSLALRADGTVLAWGDNSFTQTTVPGAATNVTAIAAGYDHSLALKADGTVVAWGRNDSGQATVPGGLTNVVAIAAGAYHCLAVKGDGTVVAWGWDLGGQVAGATGLTGISKVAGGYAFSLALKNDGTLIAWGDNTDGQTVIPDQAVNVTAISAGPSHALALRADLIPAQVARLDQDNVFTGKVGIKRTPVTNPLEVEGQASKTTAGNWLANSDRRIKTEVQPLTGALEKLSQVRLVDFRYTDDYRAAHPGIEDKRYLNVIAQEFAKVFPDDVKSSGETLPDGSPILQVDTYPLTIYSAAAVQELQRQFRSENDALKKQLAEQEERLRKLESFLK